MAELARGRGHSGSVTAFDVSVGLGTVESDAGDRFEFHCIEIADGSRSIEVGASVTFDVIGKLGRFEAANIRE